MYKDLFIVAFCVIVGILLAFDKTTHLLGDTFEPCDKWKCNKEQVLAWHKERGTVPISKNWQYYAHD